MVNGVVYDKYQGLPFSCEAANGNIGKIRIVRRDTASVVDYYDDLTVYQYNCFTGALPQNVDLTVGEGESAPQSVKIPLTLSNGVVIDVDATLNIDTTDIAQNIAAQATLKGFDDKVNAVVDVSNYYIDTIGFTKGSEFTTAPLAGGKVSSITLVSKSGRNKEEKAVAVWFDNLNNIKSVKSVTIPAMAKGAKATVNVDMELPAQVDGGKLKIFILDSITSLIPIDFVAEVSAGITESPTVYTVGDSTMCDYPITTKTQWPRTGVGMVLGNYFDGVSVNNNYANSGESTETIISEGWWNGVVSNLKVGDYVIISLGHNDQGNCETKHPNACVYKENLQKMLDDANAKGANVIFYSPIRRQHEADMVKFPDPFGSHYYTVKHSHYKDMADVVTEGKAAGKSVSYIDMTKISGEMLEGKTADEQKKYYVADAGINTSVYSSHEYWAISTFNGDTEKAAKDTSHYNVFGAKTYARRIADEIKKLDIILSDYVNNTVVPAYPGF